ncbi:MAG TPA: hypothetical protein VG708_02810 [Mycobacteriales bacterium]|nr:hypothetical protein [Mycobacteriales bacterium]
MTVAATRTKATTAIAVAVFAVLLSSLGSVSNAAASSHPKPVTVTGHRAASLRDSVELLTGSADHAVYSTQRALVVAGSVYGSGKSRPVLTVRSKSGKTVRLGAMSNRVQRGQFSTLGHWVVAWSSSEFASHSPVVDLWNVITRHHHVVKLAQAPRVLQATPRGFVYTFGHSLHEWVAGSRSSRSWGTPFPSQRVASIAADDHRLIVTGVKSGARLMAFSHPGAYRKLHSGAGAHYCYALDHAGAACRIDEPHQGSEIGFLPLDGSTETRASKGTLMLDDIGLAGKEVFFTAEQTDDAPYLYGFSPAHPTPVKWPTLANHAVVSAFGKALVMRNQDPHVVLAATTPLHLTTAFAIPRSAEAAGSFAFAPDRIVYVSDPRNASDPAQTRSVQSASVTKSGRRVKVGAPHQVAGRDGQLQVVANGTGHSGPAATATTAAFMRASDCCTWHAYVTTAAGTVELPGTFDPNFASLEAAGHWVLAANLPGPVELYDVNTGNVQPLPSVQAEQPASFALTPSRLVYATSAGVVRERDLTTGVTSTVYTSSAGSSQHPSVYAIGNWVAWDIEFVHGGKVVHSDGMRHVGTSPGPVVHLPYQVYGLSDAGALMFTADGSFQRRISIRPFHGTTHALLSFRQFLALPQVADGVLAWVDGGGDLQVERYPS